MTYTEAVLELCESFEIEPAVAAGFLDNPTKEKIKTEASGMNMLPRTSKLPI